MNNRQTIYDFDRRISRRESDSNYFYDENLVSSDGMHFHVWIPKTNSQDEQIYFDSFKSEMRRKRDCVSFSWDYLPEEYSKKIIWSALFGADYAK